MSKTTETVLKWAAGVPAFCAAMVGLMLGLEAVLDPLLDLAGLP